MRKNTLVSLIVFLVFVLALAVVFPIKEGLLGKRAIRLGLDLQGGVHIVYKADLSSVAPGEEAKAIEGAIAILENRVNPLGVTEPLTQKQGNDRISVELPGVKMSDKEKESLSRVTLLDFGELVSGNETAKWENERGKWKPATAVINGEAKELTSRFIKGQPRNFTPRGDC